MKLFTTSFFVILLLLAAAGCGKKTGNAKDGSDSTSSAYIQGHTSGIVGSRDFIQVILNNPVEGYLPGEEIKEKLFEFSPSIKGKSFLVAGSILEFRPDKPLSNGTRYTAEFSLGRLSVHSEKAGLFSFQFEVVALDFSVLRGSMIFGAYDKDNMLKYEGRILCSDQMNPDDFAKIFSVQGTKKRVGIQVEQVDATTFHYRLDSIVRLDDTYSFNLRWDGGNMKIKESGSYEIEVPGKNEFKVLSVKVEPGEDQFIRINFSDPVDPSQSLQGLVNLGDNLDLRISRVNNAVYVYPKTRLSGEQQLRIEAGIRSINGNVLKAQGSFLVTMEELAPKVEFIGSGSLMPDSKGLFLPFRAVSLRAVDVIVYKVFTSTIQQFFQYNTLNTTDNIKNVGRPVYRKTIRLDLNQSIDLKQWNAFSIDLAPLVKKDPKALYKVEIRFRLPFALSKCSEEHPGDIVSYMLPETFDEEYLASWDSDSYYYEDFYPEGFEWENRDNPCHVSYYNPERFVSKNILATNLGILVKSYDHRKFTLVVTNLLTAKPMAGAKVRLFNFQQQLLGQGTAGNDGIAEVNLDQVPYLVEASADNQVGYLRVDDGTSLSTASFEVDGEEVRKGVKGFLYGERDVWRPGDTLFLTFFLSDKDRILPADQPVVFELFNSKSQQVSKQVKTSGQEGFYCFPTPTVSDAPTGNWLAVVQVGGTRFEKQLKVEMIKPNRLKINIDFTSSPLRSGRTDQKAMFRSAWLHGASAGNLRAEVKVRFTKRQNQFSGYANYFFDDPVKVFGSYEETAFDGNLDPDGYAEFPLNFQANQDAPGMLNAVFNSRVFEQGGDFSADMISVPFSPFDRYVGISAGSLSEAHQILETGKNHKINIVVVNPEGVPVQANRLIARVYKIEWRWWWGASEEDLASYIGRKDEFMVQENVVSAPNGKGSFTFRVDYPAWGRYLVIVSDPEKGHSAGQIIYADWPSSVDRSGRENPSGAAILSFSADKKIYHPGEKAQITFPGMENARALCTIESGSRVLETRWVEVQKGDNKVSLDITSSMNPNVYVYLTLIQPHASSSNDLPIRMYGVIPLMVEDPESRLVPKIKLPAEIRPEQDYPVEVSEQNGRSMTYTLAVVDEGLLSLTRFKTPDPWNFFNKKEALGVKTWDNFSDVLGAYGGRLESILAIGGDGGLVNPADQKANRFKPVVSFIGPFDLKNGRVNKHILKMPNYVGSVRVMVVAGKNNAWGSAEASVQVKKPLMLLATLPRVISFNEQVDVPVSIFTTDDKIKNVGIKISVSGPLELAGPFPDNVAIPAMGEVVTSFGVKSSGMPGVGKIRVDVSSGQETAFHEIEVQIHNPNPTVSRQARYVIEPGKEEKLVPVFEGDAGTAESYVEVATLPSFDLEKNLNFLINYPYGCVEQTTSSAFAQLYLGQLAELSDQDQKKVERNIAAAIQALLKFQLSDGSLAFWPGQRNVSSWGTTYALHFLLLAEQKGYLVPSGFKKKLVDYQSKTSSAPAETGSFQSDYELQQSYRLYSLALAGQPNLSAMNRMLERPINNSSASWMLASAYCLTGRSKVADKLILNLKPSSENKYAYPGSTFGSNLRDQAIVLHALNLMEREDAAFDLLQKIAKELCDNELSTQTAAYCLYAIAEFAGNRKNPGSLRFSYFTGSVKSEVNSKKSVYRMALTPSGEKGTVRVVNSGSDKLYVTVTTIGRPLIGQEADNASNLKMTVEYLDMDNIPLTVSSVQQGTDLKAKVTIINPGTYGNYANMALNQAFPSGWEIINYRVTDQESFVVESPYDYRDVRDDRVFTFFTLSAGQSVTYETMLHAAYTGQYYLPALQCGDMYDRKVSAILKGQWVQVIK